MRVLCLAAMLAAMPGAAAAEDFITGVHAASPELCARALSSPDGLQSLLEDGNVILTARGIEGIEYHCDFLQVLPARRTPGFVVTALCEEPGFAFPDLIAIVPRGEGELELTAMSFGGGTGEEGEPSGNSGLFHRCEGVSRP